MGVRDNYESITRVVQAFAGQRTWQQAELARHIGVQPRSLRQLLISLSDSGMPLEKEEEHPHVYWSVPAHWFPGGVIFDIEDWQVLVHAVLRISDTKRRAKLLGRLLAGRQARESTAIRVEKLNKAVAATPFTAQEYEIQLLIEQSILEETPLSIHYYSASKGQLTWRTISPQKLITEPHGRIAAYCHVNNALRWFRIDNIQRAQLERDQLRKEASAMELDSFLSSSVDGYRDGTDEDLAFRVRRPESTWVRGNLLPGMTTDMDARGDGIRIVARGAALVVARYVVGLGGAAVAEGDALKALVRQLAEAAGDANQ